MNLELNRLEFVKGDITKINWVGNEANATVLLPSGFEKTVNIIINNLMYSIRYLDVNTMNLRYKILYYGDKIKIFKSYSSFFYFKVQ